MLSPCSVNTALNKIEINDYLSFSEKIINNQEDINILQRIFKETIPKNVSYKGSNTNIDFSNVTLENNTFFDFNNCSAVISQFTFSSLSDSIFATIKNSNISFENCVFIDFYNCISIFNITNSIVSFRKCTFSQISSKESIFTINHSIISIDDARFYINAIKNQNIITLTESNLNCIDLVLENNTIRSKSFINSHSSMITIRKLQSSRNSANQLFSVVNSSITIENHSKINSNRGILLFSIDSHINFKDCEIQKNNANQSPLILANQGKIIMSDCDVISNYNAFMELESAEIKLINLSIVSNSGSELAKADHCNVELLDLYIESIKQNIIFSNSRIKISNTEISSINKLDFDQSTVDFNHVTIKDSIVALKHKELHSKLSITNFKNSNLSINSNVIMKSIFFDTNSTKMIGNNVVKICKDCHYYIDESVKESSSLIRNILISICTFLMFIILFMQRKNCITNFKNHAKQL